MFLRHQALGICQSIVTVQSQAFTATATRISAKQDSLYSSSLSQFDR